MTLSSLLSHATMLLERQQLVMDELRLQNAQLRGENNTLRQLADRIVSEPMEKREAERLCAECQHLFVPEKYYRTVCKPCRTAKSQELARQAAQYLRPRNPERICTQCHQPFIRAKGLRTVCRDCRAANSRRARLKPEIGMPQSESVQ